ncbi:MAG: hypothetical protein LBB53_05525 [Prevotellaceae bacterium]|jgi:hypothetical protein|nr:hypothetical protein [Prevotellaceae bacterium]
MLPIVEDFVFVADYGLMNTDNIVLLEENHYKYLTGARINHENKELFMSLLYMLSGLILFSILH